MPTESAPIMSSSESEGPGGSGKAPREKRGVPSGLWMRCDDCGEMLYRKTIEQNYNVCTKCGFHMYLGAAGRIESVLDEGTFEEWDAQLMPVDPLGFADKKSYAERLVAEQKRTGLKDAVLTGT